VSPLLPLLSACGTEPGTPSSPPTRSETATSAGGQSGSDPGGSSYSCEEIRTPVEGDEEVQGAWGPLRADDLRALAAGLFVGELLWQDGQSTTIELELSWDGPVWLVTSPYPYCPPYLELEGQTQVWTADGALDERQPAVLWGYHAEQATFLTSWGALEGRVEVDAGGLSGMITLDWAPFATFTAVREAP
jgi:hypothetical protein